MPEPSWDTPARLNGLRPKTWKKREGVTRDGTMAEMVELWLSQPDHVKQDCDIGWGPNEQGHSGSIGAQAIARYVERRKLPPQMASRYKDADAALRQFLSLAQPVPRDPDSILTAEPTTPSQYAHILASKSPVRGNG